MLLISRIRLLRKKSQSKGPSLSLLLSCLHENALLTFPIFSYIKDNRKDFFKEFSSIAYEFSESGDTDSQKMKTLSLNGVKLELAFGNIVKERVDAIVNAANSMLNHGGGVAGAIKAAAGPALVKECEDIVRDFDNVRFHFDRARKEYYTNAFSQIPVGNAVETGAGSLPCKRVIHAVGPRWGEDSNAPALLKQAVFNSLKKATTLGFLPFIFLDKPKEKKKKKSKKRNDTTIKRI